MFIDIKITPYDLNFYYLILYYNINKKEILWN